MKIVINTTTDENDNKKMINNYITLLMNIIILLGKCVFEKIFPTNSESLSGCLLGISSRKYVSNHSVSSPDNGYRSIWAVVFYFVDVISGWFVFCFLIYYTINMYALGWMHHGFKAVFA